MFSQSSASAPVDGPRSLDSSTRLLLPVPGVFADSLGKTTRGMFRMSGTVVRSVRGMLGLYPSVRGRGQAHLQARLLLELQVNYLRPWLHTLTLTMHVPSYAVTQRNRNQQHKTGRLRITRDD